MEFYLSHILNSQKVHYFYKSSQGFLLHHSFLVLEDVKKRPGTYALGALCAIPAIEMAFLSARNGYKMAKQSSKDEALRFEMGGNLLGTILLTSCVLELFLGARLCGIVGFVFYSVFKVKDTDNQMLITARFIRFISFQLVTPLVAKIVNIVSVIWQGLRYLNKHKIITTLVLAGTYLIVAEQLKHSHYEVWRYTWLKIEAILSKVLPKVKS